MKVLTVLFLAIASLTARADVAAFVEKHIVIDQCKFDKPFLVETLHGGFNKVAAVNPRLVDEIVRRTSGRNLQVICDIADRNKPVFYSEATSSIHLRVTNDGTGMTNANFFHEFMHFAGLEHVDLPENASDLDIFSQDPVYACHLTAFPAIAKALDLDKAIVKEAAAKCATVTF